MSAIGAGEPAARLPSISLEGAPALLMLSAFLLDLVSPERVAHPWL